MSGNVRIDVPVGARPASPGPRPRARAGRGAAADAGAAPTFGRFHPHDGRRRRRPYTMPTISVLMSVYNGQAFVGQAVESILAQTFADFEFLILDDGSKDASMDVLRPYAERDPRIKLTARPNKGLTKTLNELFARSEGDFIARMDCDDVALPDRFATQLN